jgi:hypothetical protein
VNEYENEYGIKAGMLYTLKNVQNPLVAEPIREELGDLSEETFLNLLDSIVGDYIDECTHQESIIILQELWERIDRGKFVKLLRDALNTAGVTEGEKGVTLLFHMIIKEHKLTNWFLYQSQWQLPRKELDFQEFLPDVLKL